MRMVFLPIPLELYRTPSSTVQGWAAAVDAAVPELEVVVVAPGDDPSPALAGAGAVGTVIAERARAFGISPIGIDAKPEDVRADLDALYDPSSLQTQLPLADWVVLTVPHTPDTYHLIGAAELTANATNGPRHQ